MTSRSRPHPHVASVEAIPLRSLTLVWAGLGIVLISGMALAGKGLWSSSARAGGAQAAALAKGPTKKQARERQEHIALTERALELARKEQKAKDAAAAAPAASSPASAPASAASAASPASAGTSSPASEAGDAVAPAKAAAPSSTAQEPAARPQKAAPASGLDEMRADIASQFE